VPEVDLSKYGIKVKNVLRNVSVPILYEKGVSSGDAIISSAGAMIAYSGAKTGRSPNDKRIVKEPSSDKDIWWGKVNKPMSEQTWALNRNRAVDYLNTKSEIYVVDAFANWDPKNRVKVRIVCARPYHALFMNNMLIRPTNAELASFGEPDFTIFNAGQFPANTLTEGMTSNVSIDVNFGKNEMVILGSQYAGEMKKGVFTVMNYLMPKKGLLSMHASANEGKANDVTIFFGLSVCTT
jgi:phosphoenolpyruvate carboxykinase (ATP)